MFKSLTLVVQSVLLFLVFFVVANNCENALVRRLKRADIDLQTCIDNFDVHRDKIIRTQDSQNMGAKYLNEIDLGTRDECLRLCCETVNCDVFVFEEKNSGSCYLFHCGPPEDFKCKFTHHVNYSSAVLAINRHLPDLESQIKLTKHEQDLTKLRKSSETMPEVPPQVPTSASTSTTTIKSKEVLPSEIKTKPPEESRKCSRYQFECRSTSECIAIYNACDGIPQCADGSDEAPELGCPETLLTTPSTNPVHINNNPPPPPRYDSNIQQPRLNPLPPVLPQPEMYRPQFGPQEVQIPPSPRQQQQQQQQDNNQDFLRPMPNSRIAFDGPPQAPPQYGSGAVMQAAPGSWVPHQSNQMPGQMQYADKNSHIFNHKESGLQVPDGQEIRYNNHKGAMQYLHRALGYASAGQIPYGGDYPKVPPVNYYDNYRQQQPMQPETWPGNPQVEQDYNQYPKNNWPHQQEVVKNAKTTSPDGQFNWKTDGKENPKHEQDKMAHELKHSKESMEHGEQEAKIKIEKHKHVLPHVDQYPDVVAYKIDEATDLQDGVAETPGGAVLSLTLGLIITCIMALLIGCRLRVRRRMRKGGKSYAHDADYLVNGMYL